MTTRTIKLGPLENISPGQGRSYIVNGEEIAVFRLRNDQLFAIQNLCPHKQGPLAEGITGDGKVICPLHAHKFNLATGQGNEDGECVKTFSVRTVNGEILLDV